MTSESLGITKPPKGSSARGVRETMKTGGISRKDSWMT